MLKLMIEAVVAFKSLEWRLQWHCGRAIEAEVGLLAAGSERRTDPYRHYLGAIHTYHAAVGESKSRSKLFSNWWHRRHILYPGTILARDASISNYLGVHLSPSSFTNTTWS